MRCIWVPSGNNQHKRGRWLCDSAVPNRLFQAVQLELGRHTVKLVWALPAIDAASNGINERHGLSMHAAHIVLPLLAG